MCGIAGFWLRSGAPADPLAALHRMTGAVAHRGPDDAGTWLDPDSGVGLGHRRLSIIDPTPRGHQPMLSASGRYVVILNGEIYNYRVLRQGLARDGAPFRGESDTEVLLAAIERHGMAGALNACVGMFALAAYDRQERVLHLARDRLGEKPLYFGWVDGALLFGSELKALRAFPGWQASIDRGALALYLRHNCVPAPYSIYRGFGKVEPGTLVSFSVGVGADRPQPATLAYWRARDAVQHGVDHPFAGGPREAVLELERVLREAVRGQLIADVPLGAFLSGGIDSSLVVALMQAESSRPVRTFTVGFHESGYNEAEFARAIATHLGTDHTELYVTPEETLAVVPRLPTLYDEPFGDSSQVPTALLARLARRHVTVCLSGDGGDELFGGYWRYLFGARLWRVIGAAPALARRLLARALRSVAPGTWDAAFDSVFAMIPARRRVAFPGDRMHKLATILESSSAETFYRDLNSHWRTPEQIVLESREPPTALTDPERWAPLPDMVSRMMFLDSVTYLPDDILVKVDRACMGVALESRAPFLDHRVYEMAWRLPLALKVRAGRGKWILRQLLSRFVPLRLFERPKMGFGVPIERWLRGGGPLAEWASDLLAPETLQRQGFLRPEPIARLWREHQSGRRNWQYLLWDVLMFQAWLAEQGS